MTMINLPKKQKLVCELLKKGLSNDAIAEQMGVTKSTVIWHLGHIFKKFQVKNRTELLVKYTNQEKNNWGKVIEKLRIAVEALKQWDSDIAKDALAKIKEDSVATK